MKKIILVGGGGHCKVVTDTILLENQYEIVGITDLKKKIGEKVCGLPIIGTDDVLEYYPKKGVKFCIIALGSIGNLNVRINLYNKIRKFGFKFPNIIHTHSIVSKFTKIGEGNYIAAGAIINAGVSIGNNCIINTGAIIDHDCKIGDFVHIAPGVVISGGTEIGNYSHIGPGSSIIQCIKIGENTMIGAGSVVVNNIGDNAVAYGNPCKKVRKKNG
jgi:sugar O-acyltransferase (sialic acid O-acetyltransferase NeuD family)